MRDPKTPEDLDAERALLGAVIVQNDVFDDVAATGLRPGHFHSPNNQVIADEIWAMRAAGVGVDVQTLKSALERREKFHSVGGDVYLARLVESVPVAANAVHYAETVRGLAQKRRLIEVSMQLQREAFDPRADPDALVEMAEGLIFGVSEDRSTIGAVPVGSQIDAVMERYAARCNRQALGMGTGFRDLDALVSVEPGQLVVIAGRPSMGKTACSMNIVEHVSMDSSKRSLVVSLEMSEVELVERLLVSRARVDGSILRRGIGLVGEDLDRWNRATADVFRATIDIDASLSNTLSKVGALARRQKRRAGLDLLMIDYLQLLDGENGKDRREQIDVITRRLKTMARELEIPIIVLSQLNRASESREDKRPRMADLRESGSIEQDADHVWLIHRPEYYDPADSPGVAELIVAKNRGGPTDTIKLTFEKRFVRFSDYADAPIPDAPAEGGSF